MHRLSDPASILPRLMVRPVVAMLQIAQLRDDPGKVTVWADDTDILCLTDAGIALPVFTTAAVGAHQLLIGQSISGIIGHPAAVTDLHSALDLPQGALHRTEPHLELSLADLNIPDTRGMALTPAAAFDTDMLTSWRIQYGIDALDLPPAEAVSQAGRDVAEMQSTDTHHILLHAGVPFAMTGFRVTAGDTVMVGGVYTPAHLRGRGYARTAVALHLAMARGSGIKTAVLSAANLAAAAAYTAIGFQQVGEFMIILYNKPQVPHG